MSSVSILFAKQGKEAEKRKYERRKEQVTTVKGRISDASDDNVTSINGKIEDIGAKVSSAISGIASVATLVTEMKDKKEKGGTSDNHLSSYESCLVSEIADCDQKISNLEADISALNSQYQTALHEEEEAARKALEATKTILIGG